MYGSDKTFVEEREFTTDCKLLTKSLPQLIGIDDETTHVAEGVVRRFLAMYDTILRRIENISQAGGEPSQKQVRSAEIGMKRLLEMAALNQRSAFEYVRAVQRERAIGGHAVEFLLSDEDCEALLDHDGSVLQLMNPTDRAQATLPDEAAPNAVIGDSPVDVFDPAGTDPTETTAYFAGRPLNDAMVGVVEFAAAEPLPCPVDSN